MDRDVAQFGSALVWGTRGRRFKSCLPDFLGIAQLVERCVRDAEARRFKSCYPDKRKARHYDGLTW